MKDNNTEKDPLFKGLDFEAYFAANDKRFENETLQSIKEYQLKRYLEGGAGLVDLYSEKFIPFLIWRELRQFYGK